MKRVFLLAVAICILFSAHAASFSVFAADTPAYCRVLQKNAVLYKTPVEHYDYALFYLPYSYYLPILGKEGGFFLVEYQDGADGYPVLYGYVKQDAVSLDYQSPSLPLFPKETLTVIQSSYIYTRPSRNSDLLASALKDQSVRVYGSYPEKDSDRMYHYVKFGQIMGYIPAENCSAPFGSLHPDEILPPSSSVSAEPAVAISKDAEVPASSSGTTDVLQIVVIVAVTLVVLVVVYAVFRPKKRNDRFFGDEDE